MFTTGEEQQQELGRVDNRQRPTTGSDWGLLGATSNPTTPTYRGHAAGSTAAIKPRAEMVADEAADALLRRAGAY